MFIVAKIMRIRALPTAPIRHFSSSFSFMNQPQPKTKNKTKTTTPSNLTPATIDEAHKMNEVFIMDEAHTINDRLDSFLDVPTISTTKLYGNHTLSVEGNIPYLGNGIAIGQFAEILRTFTETDTKRFAEVTGDFNPIHQPDSSNSNSNSSNNNNNNNNNNNKVLVHGMLVASLFSTIFGTIIPSSIYRTQQMKFRTPIFVDEPILARIDVTGITQFDKGIIVKCDTSVLRPRSFMLSVSGTAEVWLEGVDQLSSFVELVKGDLDMR